jgi:endoglucanase
MLSRPPTGSTDAIRITIIRWWQRWAPLVPKEVFYGNNRADFSFIPGNVAPGILFRQPDHFENYDDWPFLWGQNEGTIGGNTSYLIFGTAFKNLIK